MIPDILHSSMWCTSSMKVLTFKWVKGSRLFYSSQRADEIKTRVSLQFLIKKKKILGQSGNLSYVESIQQCHFSDLTGEFLSQLE